MPDINEFISSPAVPIPPSELQLIPGKKPCKECEMDAEESYWDAKTRSLSWTCSNGHENKFQVS